MVVGAAHFAGLDRPGRGGDCGSGRPTARSGADARSRPDPPQRQSSPSRLMMSSGRDGATARRRDGATIHAITRSTACITSNRVSPAAAVPNYAPMSCRSRRGSAKARRRRAFAGEHDLAPPNIGPARRQLDRSRVNGSRDLQIVHDLMSTIVLDPTAPQPTGKTKPPTSETFPPERNRQVARSVQTPSIQTSGLRPVSEPSRLSGARIVGAGPE
jgi:hypothetical protein